MLLMPGRAPSRWSVRVLALLAAIALLQPALLTMVNPALLGWRPDHGHVFAGGVPHAHTHPWDHPSTRAASDSTQRSVTFTAPEDDVAIASAAVEAMPAPAAFPTVVLSRMSGRASEPLAPRTFVPGVPSPPPRG